MHGKTRRADIPTIPLFNPGPPQPVERKRPKAARPYAFGRCPHCHSADRHALVLQGIHLVWRPHLYRTVSGAPLPCPTSGVTLCVAASRDGVVRDTPNGKDRTHCTCLRAAGELAQS